MIYNLVEYLNGFKVKTHIWNAQYQLCKGMKLRLELQLKSKGTYFKIEKNEKQNESEYRTHCWY